MKIHRIPSWVCTGPNFNGIVYDQKTALDKLEQGCDIELVIRERVCVLDRPDDDGANLCYMCNHGDKPKGNELPGQLVTAGFVWGTGDEVMIRLEGNSHFVVYFNRKPVASSNNGTDKGVEYAYRMAELYGYRYEGAKWPEGQ